MCENGYVMKEILFMYNMSISNAENWLSINEKSININNEK
jgi:hypothetical protein